MIIESVASSIAIWASIQGMRWKSEAKNLERVKCYYEERKAYYEHLTTRFLMYKETQSVGHAVSPGDTPRDGDTQQCGGCGHYLSQAEIEACPGVDCSRYAETMVENKSLQARQNLQ